MKKIGLSLLLTALLAACASDPTTTAAPATPTPVPAKAAPTAAPVVIQEYAAPATKIEASKEEYNPLTDKNNILSERYVYFDFDKYDIKEESTEVIEAHGNYLSLNDKIKVSLQGHADERGTAEYNLALGQKRADAVKNMLTSVLGVPATQIETVSYGEERPAVQGKTEEAWAKNRRVVIVYPGEKLN